MGISSRCMYLSEAAMPFRQLLCRRKDGLFEDEYRGRGGTVSMSGASSDDPDIEMNSLFSSTGVAPEEEEGEDFMEVGMLLVRAGGG